jgi:putative hydrolase
VSTPGPLGGGNPFEGLPIFGDLAKLFMSGGAVHWEIARQMGTWLASGGQPEAGVDPLSRIRLEELLRVAELHVAQASGLSTSSSGKLLTIDAVTPSQWAGRTLDEWKPLLERLATSLSSAPAPGEEPDPAAQFLGDINQVLGPVLMGFQAGSLVGHLAQRAFGQYDLPIPRPSSDSLLVVPSAIDTFAADWSLPVDDVRLWVCLNEVTHHAVLGRPHVRQRLDDLLAAYAGGFRPDPEALQDRLGALDPTDPTSFQQVLGDPEAVLGAIQTDEQRALRPRLDALVAVIEGYVDHVVDVAGTRLLGSYGALGEAVKRRRVERGEGDAFLERMFGLELGQGQYDRGAAFVKGVVERGGEDALARLWVSERELPTPAEVDAPGLWLERIDIPD